MNINIAAGVALLSNVGVAVEAGETIVSQAVSLIDTVEQLYTGLKGDAKFQAVLAGLKTVVADLGLTDEFDKISKAIGPFVSLVVTIWNLANLWPHKQAS